MPGKEVTLQARLRGQALTVNDFSARLVEDQAPGEAGGRVSDAAGAGRFAGRWPTCSAPLNFHELRSGRCRAG